MPRRPLGEDPRLRRSICNEADRLLRAEASSLGETFRERRLRLRIAQADIARAIGVSRSVISAAERGDPGVGLRVRFRMAEVLGCRLRLPLYPDGTPRLHDQGHAAIIEYLLGIRHRRWQAELEARVPGPGQRSSDFRLQCERDIVLGEVEMVIRRWEEILRELHDKARAVAESVGSELRVHSLLVVPPTRRNRELLGGLEGSVAAAFPADEGAIYRALTGAHEPWPGDGILWLPPPRKRGTGGQR